MTRRLKILAGGAAAIAVAIVVMLPPAAVTAPAPPATTARGAFHVHSSRSDGSGTVDAIAAAAARAGLQFVILTDHGDATRAPEAPRYIGGVLTIDGVELNTTAGHFAAVGMTQSPYPIAGTPRDVIADVHRLGGFGVAAHGASPRASLSWREWDAPIDGLEWINSDSEWRDESRLSIARALLRGARILIFDDSFSALDFGTEARLRAALRNETADATVFIVAQRISTVIHADRIIVLDDGRVAGIGTHADLLKESAVYREIVASEVSLDEVA